MRKNLISALVAGSMLVASTAASADTRPTATRFSQPEAAAGFDHQAANKSGLLWLFLTGGLTLAALIAILSATGSNSPTR